MPVEQLRDLQLERMKKTVQHSYDNVAFYQRSFKEAGVEPGDLKTLEDLPKFPFVVKQDMRDAYPFGLFAVPQKDVARIHASSGTTGQATVVGHTANDLKNWGDCFARGIHMVNGNEDSTIQVSYGYGLFTGGLGAHYGGEAAGCTVIPTSSGNTKRQIQMMKDLGTDILACTPSYALLIADSSPRRARSTTSSWTWRRCPNSRSTRSASSRTSNAAWPPSSRATCRSPWTSRSWSRRPSSAARARRSASST